MTFSFFNVVSKSLRPLRSFSSMSRSRDSGSTGSRPKIEEDLGAGLFVGAFQPVVEQALVDQADELRAKIGVIDRAFHEGLLMPFTTGSGPRRSFRST